MFSRKMHTALESWRLSEQLKSTPFSDVPLEAVLPLRNIHI
jgi:hypothetical protein